MTAKDIPYINTMFISIECLYLQCPELVLIEDGGKKMTEFVVMTYGTPSQTFTIHAKTLAQKLDWCIQLRKLTNHIVPNKAQRLLVSATNGE